MFPELKELEEDAGKASWRRCYFLSSRSLCSGAQPDLRPSIFSQWQIQAAPGILFFLLGTLLLS